MDTQSIEGQGSQGRSSEGRGRERRKPLPRVLTMAALACFALPFLTVTCYGETTVSGVQAATEIDLYPNDDPGEQELVRDESPNAFAFVALAAVIVALALAFGSARPRELLVWTPAVGAIALMGLFAYSFYRSWGEAWPRIGFVGALMCLVGAAWAGVGRVPAWVGVATAGVAVSMIPGTLVGMDDLPGSPLLYGPVLAGVFIAVTLAVGAIRASMHAPVPVPMPSKPSTLRVVIAGITGVACVAVAGIGSFFLMSAMVSGDYGPDGAGRSYLFAIGMLAVTIAASVVAWIAGEAIVRGERRVPSAPIRSEVRV